MKTGRRTKFVVIAVLLAFLVAAFFFVFNPLGLGPEPESVLAPEFFDHPAEDLSGLELLIDGEEAFDRVVAAIDSAESSIFVQTYIWKDDVIGRLVADRLKQAAKRGVQVR